MGFSEAGAQRDRLLQLLDRGGLLSSIYMARGGLYQNHGASLVGDSQVDLFERGQFLPGFSSLAGSLQCLRQTGVGLRQVRIERDGSAELFYSAVQVVRFQEHCSQDVMALGIFRQLGHSQTEFSSRGREVSALPQRQAQRAVGQDMIRINPDGLSKLSASLLHVTLESKREAEIVVIFRIPGIQ